VSRSSDGFSGEVLGRDVVSLGQRLHVGDEAPDLVVANSSSPGGHSVWSAFVDRLEDVGGCPAKMPTVVLKARAHRARPFGAVAVHAVVRDEQLRSFGNARLIALERICQFGEARLEAESRLDVVGVLDEIRRLRALLRA